MPTPEELALLTDEERAGLEEDHDEDVDTEDDEDTTDEGSDAGDDAGGDDAGDDSADDQQPGRDDGADAADADDAGADKPEAAQDADRPVPLLKVEAVEDAEAKLADIDKREDEISQKFEDGDITTTEYRAELRKLERERTGIENQQREADFANRINQAQVDARWQADVQSFLDTHPEVGKNATRWSSFDAVVRQVTADAMKEGKNPGTAELKAAYKKWAEDLGIQAPKPEAKQEPKDGKQTAKKRELPPTLASVPSAQISDTDDGRWSKLDRLMDSDPLAYERAVAKLSDADREAYLASQ